MGNKKNLTKKNKKKPFSPNLKRLVSQMHIFPKPMYYKDLEIVRIELLIENSLSTVKF